MGKRLDIVDVKQSIKDGFVQLKFHNGSILLVDTTTQEAVRIGILPVKDGDNDG